MVNNKKVAPEDEVREMKNSPIKANNELYTVSFFN